MRKTIVVDFSSLKDKDPLLVENNVKRLFDLLFSDFEIHSSKFGDLMDEQIKHMLAISTDWRLEPQRLHAVQSTESCELKSLTVAAAYLLEDELAYQNLIDIFLRDADELYRHFVPKQEQESAVIDRLVTDGSDLKRRLLERHFLEHLASLSLIDIDSDEL